MAPPPPALTFVFTFMFIAPLWFWVAVRIETVSLTSSNFCFHLHVHHLLWFWLAVWIETISITGFDRGPYFHKHSCLQQFGFYPKGSNPQPSPALTLLFTFMTSLLPDFVFLSNVSWNCAQNSILFPRDATYDGNGPSVLHKQ